MGFLDFFLVCCRTLHVFSAAMWIGGLGFLGGVAGPVFKHFGAKGDELSLPIERRFIGFVWTSAWGVGLSGLLLMLLSDRFVWLDFSTPWRQLLIVKQVLFLGMVAASLAISATLKEQLNPRAPSVGEELSDHDRLVWRKALLSRLNLICGITAMIIAAMMH